jgi:hypothetical protein
VFGDRVLRRIFGPKREELVGDWRKLHDVELHNLHASSNIITDQIKEDELGWSCSKHGSAEKFVQNCGRKT